MEHYNTIYVLRTYAKGTAMYRSSKLYILNPDDGSIITEKNVDFPGDDGPINSMAIGCGTKLLLLNSAGWLNIYREKLTILTPGEMGFVKKKQRVLEIK